MNQCLIPSIESVPQTRFCPTAVCSLFTVCGNEQCDWSLRVPATGSQSLHGTSIIWRQQTMQLAPQIGSIILYFHPNVESTCHDRGVYNFDPETIRRQHKCQCNYLISINIASFIWDHLFWVSYLRSRRNTLSRNPQFHTHDSELKHLHLWTY